MWNKYGWIIYLIGLIAIFTFQFIYRGGLIGIIELIFWIL